MNRRSRLSARYRRWGWVDDVILVAQLVFAHIVKKQQGNTYIAATELGQFIRSSPIWRWNQVVQVDRATGRNF